MAEEPVPDRLRAKVHARTLQGLNDFAEPLATGLDPLDDAYYAEPRDLDERIETFLATAGRFRLGRGAS